MKPRASIGVGARCLTWLFPWFSVLVVSGAIVLALEQSFGHGSPDQSLLPAVAAIQASTLPASPVDTDGLRWVTIASGQVGRAELCLTASNAVSADIIEVH